MDKKPEHIPKNGLHFCLEMVLAQFPEMGFFVQKSRIVVKHWSVILIFQAKGM